MKLFWLLFISVFQKCKATLRLSDEDYELMPPIVSLDPFEKCLRSPGGLYCTAHASYVSDEPSPLLHQMKEYSSHTPTRFNHTRLFYGTCLSHKCRDLYNDTTATDLRDVLEACLNQTVFKEYNLKVKVEEDVACQGFRRRRLNYGVVDITVATILLMLLACNIVGSFFEFYSIKQDNGAVAKFLRCFSVPRNWKRLTAPSGGADLRLERLKGIHGIRAISIIIVIVGHSMLPIIICIANPKFIEDLYDNVIIQVLLNGTLIMQTFFFLSAFLLVYIYSLQLEYIKPMLTWKIFPILILRRWLRLTPSYAVMLAVTATWLQDISSGPMWHFLITSQTEDCRRHWWKHILYMNNYEDNSLCLPETWYLAADTQLYCLGLIVVVFCQSPKSRKLVLLTLFLIGLIIPPLHTVYQDLDGVLLVSPSLIMGLFTMDPTFDELYKRGHTNVATYIVGMAFGFLVHHLQTRKFNASLYKKYRPFYWALFPLGLSIIASGKVVYEEGPRMSLASRAFASALIKPLFGISVGFFIVGMILKIERVYRGILEWPIWTYLSRVSYSAYLLNSAVVRVAAGSQDHAQHGSYIRLIEMGLFCIVFTYAGAFIFWTSVEAPLSQLVKTFLEPAFLSQVLVVKSTHIKQNGGAIKPSSPKKN